jgi:hypothetical protein
MKPAPYAASSLLLVGTAAAGKATYRLAKLRLPTPALSTAQVMPASAFAPTALGVLYQSACDIQVQA